jgi:glutamyl-tRNA synthetase
MKPQAHKLRIAPSPTGKLHIGTIRTAYFNWILSKQHPESKLIVRIDDTDLQRSKEELIQPIYAGLDTLGIDYFKSFKQSSRFGLYKYYANEFVKKGYAFEDDGCIRLKESALHNVSCDWVDTLSGIKESNEQIDTFAKSQVIMKSDGSPAYNFCSIVDDYIEEITWIVRGVDHIANSYKQALIHRIINMTCPLQYKEMPLFTHVGLVCHTSGKKLSKRDSDEINLNGINKRALLNYILRLGWSPKEDTKANNIIDRDKAIELFVDGGSMKASNAKIDFNKLEWYNKKYRSIIQKESEIGKFVQQAPMKLLN